MSLDRAPQRLESVRVLGKADSRYLVNSGFDDRRRRSLGWFMTADEIQKQSGIYLGDALRTAPGLIANYSTKGRTFSMRPMAGGHRCTPAYYLDGVRWFPLDQDPILELEKFVPAARSRCCRSLRQRGQGAGAIRSDHRVRRGRFLDEALTTPRRLLGAARGASYLAATRQFEPTFPGPPSRSERRRTPWSRNSRGGPT